MTERTISLITQNKANTQTHKKVSATPDVLRDVCFKHASKPAIHGVRSTDEGKMQKDFTWAEGSTEHGKGQQNCLCPATFTGDKRLKKQTVSCSAYIIDLDKALPADVESVKSNLALLGLMAWGWTTWSSGSSAKGGPDHECWRFVIPFSKDAPTSLDGFEDAGCFWSDILWGMMNKELALGRNDAATKDPSRLHFMPAHPEFIVVDDVDVKNKQISWWSIDGSLYDPTSVVRAGEALAQQMMEAAELKASTAIVPHASGAVAAPGDFSEVNDQMLGDMRWLPDLLEKISPSGDRNHWLSTMRAIRGLDGGSNGMKLFHSWSLRHDAGYSDMDAMRDWTSLDGDDGAKALKVLTARGNEVGWTYRSWCKANGVSHPKSKVRKAQEAQSRRQMTDISADTQLVMDELLMSQGKDPKMQRPLSTDGNHTTIVLMDRNLSKTFCYDMFTRTVMVMNSGGKAHLTGPFPREVRDEDYSHLAMFIQGAYSMGASSIACRTSVDAVARMPLNRFDSLRDKLLGLKWDGVKRLDTFGVDYLNVEDTTFNQYATKRFMIAAVARALDENPNGTKMDCCLILEGKQGFQKSEAIRTLSFHRYTNAVKPDPENKDNFLKMRGVLMAEFGEFEQYVATDKSDGKLKDFMSTNVDTYREPYKSQTESFNRRFVFVGTTNERNYLKDPTGNRRYWPVVVQSRIDLEKLERDLGQLWAEAVECFRDFQDAKEDGVPKDKNLNRWWFEDSEEVSAQAGVVESRVNVDSWEEILGAKLKSTSETSMNECYLHLGIAVEHHESRKQSRIVTALKRLGFQTKPIWNKEQKRKVNVWVRSET